MRITTWPVKGYRFEASINSWKVPTRPLVKNVTTKLVNGVTGAGLFSDIKIVGRRVIVYIGTAETHEHWIEREQLYYCDDCDDYHKVEE